MSVQLLDRTRKINKLLHNSSSSKVVFNDICQVLMETLSSNILVLSKKGKVLAEILVKILSMTPNKLQTITPDNFRSLAKDFKVSLPEEFLYEKQ